MSELGFFFATLKGALYRDVSSRRLSEARPVLWQLIRWQPSRRQLMNYLRAVVTKKGLSQRGGRQGVGG